MSIFTRVRFSSRLRHAEHVLQQRALAHERRISGALATLDAIARLDAWDGATPEALRAAWGEGLAVFAGRGCRVPVALAEDRLARVLMEIGGSHDRVA